MDHKEAHHLRLYVLAALFSLWLRSMSVSCTTRR